MHEYTIDSGERRYITVALALLGVPAAYVLSWVLNATHLSAPWWLDAPAVLGFGGIFYSFFERYLWRWKPLHRFRVVRTPDLSGRWHGEIKSLGSAQSEATAAEFRIEQTWTRMCIRMKGGRSRSASVVAAISVATEEPKLVYTYHNVPNDDAVETMEQHFGTATYRLSDDGLRVEGEYFTGRGRMTHGTLKLTRDESSHGWQRSGR